MIGWSEMQIEFSLAGRPECWREGLRLGVKAGAGRLDLPREALG